MVRSDPTERTHSTLPTTRTGNRLLQYLSAWKAGNPPHPHRNCRPVFTVGLSIVRRDGVHPFRSSAAGAARRFRAAVLAKDRSRSCGRHSESSRTRSHPRCHWRKAEPMPSFGTEAALGESIQFLSQRPTLGAHVCPHVSLLSFFRPSMPESASLAGSAHATARHHFSAMQERLLAMLQPRAVATTRRLSDRPRFIALRAEVAGRLYSLLLLPGAATGCLSAPAFLLSGRALRQPDLLPPCRRRPVRRAFAGHEPNHRTTQEDHSHLWPKSHSAIQG